MEYITTKQASKKWNITTNRITILCKEGRINGVFQMGTRWFIPSNSPKPEDNRFSKNKADSFNIKPFRFYLFDLKDDEDFNPPLTNYEKDIKKGCALFHECKFKEAELVLNNVNIFICDINTKIYTLFGRSLVFSMTGNLNGFQKSYELLNVELQKDFPNKKELSFLLYEINIALGFTNLFSDDFKIDETYPYSQSFKPHLSSLSLISLMFSKRSFDEKDLETYELILKFIDETTYYVDQQTIHCYLGLMYGFINKTDKMNYHLYKSLELGEKHKLYWLPSLIMYYYNKMVEPVLKNFSIDFYNIISKTSNEVHKSFNLFNKQKGENLFNILLSKDYIYVFYALQGYSNKEVAYMLNTSISYVNNRYSKIYQTLNVKNKKGLVNYYRCSYGNSI